MRAALLLPLLAASGSPQDLSEPDLVVAVERSDGVSWCTIRAENAPVQRVVRAVADQLGYEVEGFDEVHRAALVIADLRDRPLSQALEYVLGSVGLAADVRQGVIAVRPEAAGEVDPESLLDRAMVAYLRAGGRFPTHPLGAGARLSQGSIEELRGNLPAALGQYEFVLENYPASTLRPRATWLAARALERLGQTADANRLYQELANLEVEHDFEVEAWMGMVRTTVDLGDPGRALSVLNALDGHVPPRDEADRRERLFQRARAEVGDGRAMEALRTIEDLERAGMSAEQRTACFALGAVALEAVGQEEMAGRSWLLYARASEGEESEKALENAARLALVRDAEALVLLICEEADARGFAARLEPYRLEARRRLGLLTVLDARRAAPLERLELAEAWVRRGRVEDAAEVLESLFEERGGLDQEALVRVYAVRARVLEKVRGPEAALELLRSFRRGLEDPAGRSRLDVLAGELLERQGRFEEAIEAYGGRY